MSIWWNSTDKTLRFSFRDEIYTVPPGGEVPMADSWDWLPPKRGLPLTKGPSPSKDAPRVIPKAVEPPKTTLPAGVTSGRPPPERYWDDDGDGYVEMEPAPEPESKAVLEAVEKLKKQGVKTPGHGKR
jgi:hypothetical protein